MKEKKTVKVPKKPSGKLKRAHRTNELSLHHDHSYHLKRLNRIAGQISGVQKMLEEKRYCIEILMQTRAVASAIKSLEASILEQHLHCCVEQAFSAKDKKNSLEKISELVEFFKKDLG